MIVVDTSVWIEFFRQTNPFSSRLKKLLETREVLACSFAFGEVLQGARNNREREMLLHYWEALPHADESDLFLQAGRLSGEQHFLSQGVGLIDVAMLVFARRNQAALWTLDKKLQKLLSSKERFL